MGAKCFSEMSSLDNNTGITVLNCKLLDQLWENREASITSCYPTLDKNSYSMKNRATL